jgi:hypothetical protein
MTGLILKRASVSRPSGEWNDDDFDVIPNAAAQTRMVFGARIGWIRWKSVRARP